MSNLSPSQSNTIYNTSFLSLGSSIYAIYNGYYTISLCPAGVFLTSINYWRNPVNSWRRKLDMVNVFLTLSYQLYIANRAEYRVPFYTTTLIAGSMYPLALYYSNKKLYWHSTYAHCALHVIANIANIILYSGKIV